jgi:hypothetical protein
MIELDRRGLDPNYKDGLPERPTSNDPRAHFEFQAKTLIHLSDNDPSLAYRSAMPEPTGRRQIKQYIACIMHGLAIEALKPEEARNMLYGARTATLALSKYKDRAKKPETTPAVTEHEMYKAAQERFTSQ